MFENDDWDFDQDFLNDVDDKVIRYCSQRDNHEKEVKRRKVEINDDPIFSCNFDEDPWSEQSNSCGEAIVKRDENSQSRKNLILGIFNKNLPNKSISNNASNNPERSRDNTSSNTRATCSQDCDSDRSIRTNLVLNILQNKNAPNEAAENNRNNVDLKNTGQKVASTRRIDEKQEARGKCDTAKSNFKAASSSSSSDISAPRSSANKNSRNQPSADTSKHRSKGCAEPRNVSPQNNPRIYKPLQTSPSKKMTLVRKFPGPAGLLPDDVDSNIPCVSYLNSLEEKERASQEAESNDPAGYCSQNTKNLFTEGAWQLMLDDLPADFLNGHDLATAKRTANLNGLNSMKVEFLAGIVEHIDYSHDNPPIVLKDFTDDIRGIVHKDVPLKYPGLLETNVVILLHDVGLLRISDTFVSNKYQLLIFPSSLLAIYTSKGVIERTRYMDAVFRNTSDASGKGEAKENCALETMSQAHSSKTRASFDAESSGSSSKGPITFQGSASSKNTNSGNFDPSNEANSSKADIVNVDEPMDFDLIRFDAKNSSSSSKGPINSRMSTDSNSENTRSTSSNVPNEVETDDIDQLVDFDSDRVDATNSCSSSSSSSKRLINSENSNRKGFDLSARSNERETGNTSVSIDLDSDLSFSISPVQITDSWNSKNFDGSARKNLKHAKRESEKENSWEREMIDARNDGKGKGRDLSAILNKFLPDSYERRLPFRESKASPTNARCSSPIAGCSKRIDSEILNDIFSEKLEFDDERSANDTPAKKAKRVEETVSPCSSGNKERDAKKSSSSVRSRLLQFKSEDALTPPENLLAKPAAALDSPKKGENLAEKGSLPSCSKHGIFNDVENDSDDEILSQMDMDVIFSNYKDDS